MAYHYEMIGMFSEFKSMFDRHLSFIKATKHRINRTPK